MDICLLHKEAQVPPEHIRARLPGPCAEPATPMLQGGCYEPAEGETGGGGEVIQEAGSGAGRTPRTLRVLALSITPSRGEEGGRPPPGPFWAFLSHESPALLSNSHFPARNPRQHPPAHLPDPVLLPLPLPLLDNPGPLAVWGAVWRPQKTS